MKYYFERNLKIINELMTCLYKLGSKDINVNLHKEDSGTCFLIWGQVNNVDRDTLDNLTTILNTKRQHEVEETYWHLGGECESDGELSLVGMMIDKAEISYSNNILTLKIYRTEL
ncbi:hypothetical protein R0131_11710 [Clostridium sp. AL.422]|uniref:hypothetical protein n=1 Tax=Clostridium TaxID=1485 RepID=UPI00293DA6E2|nr:MULTISPECIES: hypothetical protein [unclassified Clostridium]MDV4151493.1 hypothetical protein [Clostridium sp. AL.422]